MNSYRAIGDYSRGAPRGAAGMARRQRGVALVVALIVLLVLTILGVSALVSTALEGLMAGNVQEQNRAFQASETGIDVALTGDGSLYVPIRNLVVDGPPVTAIGAYSARANYTNTYLGQTKPPRSRQAQGQEIGINHFSTTSVGTTANNAATVTLNRGLSQLGPALTP